jgi:hypothetical protein
MKSKIVIWTVGTFCGVCLAMFPEVGRAAVEPDAENTIDLSVVPPDQFTGEPYVLAGKRLVFTNWYYVRPGGYAWLDDQGETVTVSRKKPYGMWDAHFASKTDAPHGIRLAAQRAERYGPVLKTGRPADSHAFSIQQVLKDGDRYRAYTSILDKDGKSYTAYYESGDGLAWTRPNLGLVEYKGNKDNNFLPVEVGAVFVDPKAPPAERYKSVVGTEISFEEFLAFKDKHPDRWESRALRKDRRQAKPILAIGGMTSADGIRWNTMPEPFTVEHSDTQIVGGYNGQTRKYFVFTRNYFVGPRAVGAPHDTPNLPWLGEYNGSGRRSIGYTESDVFGDFPVSRLILAPRSDMKPGELLYTNCYTTIPGAPDHHLLFPTVWDTTSDATHLEMAASHDGRVWNWTPGGSLMDTQAPGEFDGGCIFWAPSLIELANGDFALPYTGYRFPHKYPRGAWTTDGEESYYDWGYAIWPKGRIVALEAPELGEFTTVGLMPPGRRLRINAVTMRAGSIRVAVLTRDGRFLPDRSFEESIPIIGDQYRAIVKWKGEDGDDLGFGEDEPICLRFKMDQAKIFGLEFE